MQVCFILRGGREGREEGREGRERVNDRCFKDKKEDQKCFIKLRQKKGREKKGWEGRGSI